MLEKAKTMEKLPENFDGVFRFTNYTSTDFTAKWNNIEYTFKANKTTPMIIPNATPEEVQSIRKKFARELAVREFYGTPKFIAQNKHVEGGTPALYTDNDLIPFVQRCLEPLPIAQAEVKILPRDSEKNYIKDRKGKNVTRILNEGESLMEQASGPTE